MDMIVLLFSEENLAPRTVTTVMGLNDKRDQLLLNPKSLQQAYGFLERSPFGKVQLVFGTTALSALGCVDVKKGIISMGDFNHSESIKNVADYIEKHLKGMEIHA